MKISNQEKEVYLNYLEQYIIKKYDMNINEEYMKSNFSNYLKKSKMGNYLEIINDIYVLNDDYDKLKQIKNNNEFKDYIKNKFKDLIINKEIDINKRYYININNYDINPNYFIKNGTLVFKLQRLLDFNINSAIRIKNLKELDTYIKKIEIELQEKIGIPVKILYYDIIIPPKFN